MPKRRIGLGMLVLLLGFTVVIDIIQGILDIQPIDAVGTWVNIIIDFCVAWVLFLWLKWLGVNFKNKGTLAIFVVGIIADLIPFVDILAWTLDVLLVYRVVRSEDNAAIAAWQANNQGLEE